MDAAKMQKGALLVWHSITNYWMLLVKIWASGWYLIISVTTRLGFGSRTIASESRWLLLRDPHWFLVCYVNSLCHEAGLIPTELVVGGFLHLWISLTIFNGTNYDNYDIMNHESLTP